MKKFACTIEDDFIEDCVFDDDYYGPIDDCCEAVRLSALGYTKADCQFWLEVEVGDESSGAITPHTCPKCGHKF